MANIKYTSAFKVLTFMALVTLGLLLIQPAFALGQGSGGSGIGGGSGDQQQDRDRVQDPTTPDKEEPLQDRDRDQLRDGSGDNCVNDGDCDGVPDQDRLQIQDRDRLQDGTGDGVPDQDQDRDRLRDSSLRIGDEPIKDQDQLRDRLRDQLQDPDQDRDRDRIRANDSGGLNEVITASEEVSDDLISEFGAELRQAVQNRNRVEVGVMSIIAAQNMIGQDGGQVAKLAQEIHSTYRTMSQEEEKIQSRSFLRRLFFGGDSEGASSIQTQVQQNQQRMQQISQYLSSCGDCDESVRTMLQEQVQNMLEEHTRLKQLADDEISKWGLFSWRF